MYARLLNSENSSFFLFGPRGVGKSFWVRNHFSNFFEVDLLKTGVELKYRQNPNLFQKEIKALPKGSWVFIDEVQKLPSILDEVHSLIETKNLNHKFILTGSSARKLKKDGANLLAGRVKTLHMYPLTIKELGADFNLENSLMYGNLPKSVLAENNQERIDFLQAYTETYLKEEIQREAAVKNLSSYLRFLKISAICNGQKINLSSLSRDSGVERSTAQGYLQVLVDTLLGELLQPLALKFRVKEVGHPKFYYFDCGVIRSLNNMIYDPLDSTEKGLQFETLILNELKSYNRYNKIGGEFYYWGTNDGHEVDFIYTRGKKAVGIEIKSTKKWRNEYSKSLELLLDAKKIQSAYGVYWGEEVLNHNQVTILPLKVFVEKLWNNELKLF